MNYVVYAIGANKEHRIIGNRSKLSAAFNLIAVHAERSNYSTGEYLVNGTFWAGYLKIVDYADDVRYWSQNETTMQRYYRKLRNCKLTKPISFRLRRKAVAGRIIP
jgi:hypothetical protein